MAVEQERLIEELQAAAGLAGVRGVTVVVMMHPTDTPSTFHQRTVPQGGELVRVDWVAVPTSSQRMAAQIVVLAHDGTLTAEEKFDGEPSLSRKRILAAVTLRASTQWTTVLNAQQRSRIQTLIDNAATRLIQLLSS